MVLESHTAIPRISTSRAGTGSDHGKLLINI
jgi:hypothetical protein